jgi:hypothetical protein
MKVVLTDRVVQALTDAPEPVVRAFEKQLRFLAGNLHPPPRAPKIERPLASPRRQVLAVLFQDCERYLHRHRRNPPSEVNRFESAGAISAANILP